MSFLEKIGLKHKQDKSGGDVPPPPPAPGKKQDNDAQNQDKKDLDLPPLPQESSKEKQIRDLPNRADDQPSTDHPNRKPLPTKKTQPEQSSPQPDKQPQAPARSSQHEQHGQAPADAPPQPQPQQQQPSQSQQPQTPAANPPPQQPPQAPQQARKSAQSTSKSASREDLRKAFDDVPPIKSSQKKADSKITDEDVKNFEVDNMVLPGEEDEDDEQSQQSSQPQQPVKKPASKPAKEEPLFVDVETYENIQKRIRDLKRQVSGAGSHIDGILKEREQEDKEFAKFVEELEAIQDDLITIDEDLFEEQ